MKPILAMCLIAGLAALAIYKGIDGKIFAVSVAALSGLGGYTLRELWPKITMKQ